MSSSGFATTAVQTAESEGPITKDFNGAQHMDAGSDDQMWLKLKRIKDMKMEQYHATNSIK